MGSSSPPSPKTKYIPSPPPPQSETVPTQAYRTQIDLAKISNEQQRLNMEVGAQLDRTNEEFFAGQDIRRLQAQGAEQRLSTRVGGEEQRESIAATGIQERLSIAARGQEERATVRVSGEEQRKGISNNRRATTLNTSSVACWSRTTDWTNWYKKQEKRYKQRVKKQEKRYKQRVKNND